MKNSAMKGVSFGLTSGIITTLGMMIGLYAGTKSRLVVVGGILSIAVADSFSDALGIHIAEESEKKNTEKEIWASTLATFISKLVFASLFIIPVILLKLSTAIIVSIVAGLLLLAGLSYIIAREKEENPFFVIIEHLLIAVVVIVITYYVGVGVSLYFS